MSPTLHTALEPMAFRGLLQDKEREVLHSGPGGGTYHLYEGGVQAVLGQHQGGRAGYRDGARAGHGDSQRTATHPAFPHAEPGGYRYTGQQSRFHNLDPYIAIGDLYRQAIRGLHTELDIAARKHEDQYRLDLRFPRQADAPAPAFL